MHFEFLLHQLFEEFTYENAIYRLYVLPVVIENET